MKLTAQNVTQVLKECLFCEGEETTDPAIGEGIVTKFGFHKGRLAEHDKDIKEMLADLPDDFHTSKGGGMSFLNACMTRDGEQWGEHWNMGELLALGTASQNAKLLLPREMWNALPGGMPYFSVL